VARERPVLTRRGEDLDALLADLERELAARAESQRRKVFAVAHRLDPKLTWDDIANPDDHRVLKDSEAFNYEDGILAGILSAQVIVRVRLRELGAGAAPGAQEADPRPHDHDDGATRYRHCPRCGAELELRRHVSHDPPRLTCATCAFVFYVDPKIAAGVIATVRDGRIVLGRRGIPPRVGSWGFPSGYVDRGERVDDAAVREAREEVRAEVEIDRLVGIYSYTGRPVIVVVFAGRVVGGEVAAGEETTEVGLFHAGNIPWEDLAFPSTRDALRAYLGENG
jgi:ADP-ribose pyrophosphatase YjhB (NUDIX family)